MKKIKTFIYVFALLTAICAIGRACFYIIYHTMISEGGDTSFLPMLWHGLKLDVAVSGYFSIAVLLLIIVNICLGNHGIKVQRLIWNSYFLLTAFCLSLAYTSNIILYSYWGFPLDSTPLFYMLSSPKDAVASAEWWQMIVAPIVLAGVTYIIYYPFFRLFLSLEKELKTVSSKLITSCVCVLLGGLLIIPIRGGLSVAVNNVGSVYFSENIRLNHATVNPVFSFIESVSHEEDFSAMYRFMSDEEATSIFDSLTHTSLRSKDITDHKVRNNKGTRVVMVILESFSSYIMTEEGHVKGVTPTLDSLAKESIYFNRFYANSFRTDRGLVSILSGYPAQPNMSLMKYPHKTNDLYSIARSLRNDGYHTEYVYGGDANFTNMRSYLMATGFESIISEDDFPSKMRTGKWGVNDSNLFDRALAQAERNWKDDTKDFMVIQTSSSHEPFDVPCHQFSDKIFNAFYYTDRELGRFIHAMKKRKDWDNTLLVIVPDHLGCWPAPEDNYRLRRYHIPLFITGGAIKEKERLSTYGSQQDIAATVLGMLDIDHSQFTFSKDLFDDSIYHFAFFTHPDAVGMADADNQIMTDNISHKILFNLGTKKNKLKRTSQAYLQKVFDDISNR